MKTKVPAYVQNILETYLANKDNIRVDESIRVAPPHPLAPSEALLGESKRYEAEYLKKIATTPTPADAIHAREYAWKRSHYERRYRCEIASSLHAQDELSRILANARDGKTTLLYCRTKEWPCHRFILLDILHEMALHGDDGQ